jgi:deazaflavin-dependent oxidoreductase (nitroreductase family)
MNGMTATSITSPAGRSWRMARLTAPLARRFAGRRLFPLWAVVHHRGRKTGRELSVPVAVAARPDAESFLVVLPWGPGTNWARNVLAAGGCTVTWKGHEFRVTSAALLDGAQARPYFGRTTRFVVQRIFQADAFLILRGEAPGRPQDQP